MTKPDFIKGKSPFFLRSGRKMHTDLQVHQIELEMQNEALRQGQEEVGGARPRYFDLYELAPVSYITLYEQGVILEANLTSAVLLGVERGALSNQLFSGFVLPEDQDIYYAYCKRLFKTAVTQVGVLRHTCEGRPPHSGLGWRRPLHPIPRPMRSWPG